MELEFTKIIPQTSKTILFEEINSEKDSLRVILNAMQDGETFESGSVIKEIAEKLEVESFEEFLKKFKPVIYQQQFISSEGRPQFLYSLEKPKTDYVEIDICKQSFYEMVQNLIRQKSNDGKANIEGNYELIEELLSPKTELRRAMQIRQDTEYCFHKALELEKKNRPEEAKKYKKKVKENIQETKNRYEKSAVSILPLAIGDIQTVIENRVQLLENKQQEEVLDKDGQELIPKLCTFAWNDDGQLEPVEVTETIVQEDETENETKTQFLQVWENVANKTSTLNKSEYMKNTFLSCYTADKKYLKINESTEKLKKMHEEYLNLYEDTQENFLNAIGELIQKVLNVEMFFKHATGTDGKLSSNAKLIIVNCRLSDLLSEKIKKRFLEYLKSVNDTPKEKIWFAILPPVTEEDFADDMEEDIDLYNMDFEMEESSEEKENKEKVRLAEIKEMIEVLEKGKIISFFNFKASDKTGFGSFHKEILLKYQEKLNDINLKSEYAVITYPNFTVIPKEESKIIISNEIKKDAEVYIKESALTIPRIYVDSAYVAAGIICATQNISLLRRHGYSIIDGNPSIRFDIEGTCGQKINRFIFSTVFNRETLLNRSTELSSKIKKDGFGFCFSCDQRIENTTGNTYVEISRNIMGKQLYKVLVKIFMDKYIIAMIGASFAERSNLNSVIKSIKRHGKLNANSEKINRIFYSDSEDLLLNEENKVIIKFDKEEEFIDIELEEE